MSMNVTECTTANALCKSDPSRAVPPLPKQPDPDVAPLESVFREFLHLISMLCRCLPVSYTDFVPNANVSLS